MRYNIQHAHPLPYWNVLCCLFALPSCFVLCREWGNVFCLFNGLNRCGCLSLPNKSNKHLAQKMHLCFGFQFVITVMSLWCLKSFIFVWHTYSSGFFLNWHEEAHQMFLSFWGIGQCYKFGGKVEVLKNIMLYIIFFILLKEYVMISQTFPIHWCDSFFSTWPPQFRQLSASKHQV